MRASLASVLLLLLGSAAFPVEGDFRCRATGMFAEQGETLCIPTPQGLRRAHCGMALNVASWRFLDEPCPADGEPAEDSPEADPSESSPDNPAESR